MVNQSPKHEWQPILECGAEGGSITLMGRWWVNGWEFHRNLHDCSLALMDEGSAIQHESDAVDSWRKAMHLMDKYPWHRLYPLYVHPEFRAKVLKSWKHRCEKDSCGPSFNDQSWQKMLRGDHLGIVKPASDMQITAALEKQEHPQADQEWAGIKSKSMEDHVVLQVMLPSTIAKVSAWAAFLDDGRFDVTIWDSSSEIYRDHQDFYRVDPEHKELLVQAVSKLAGKPIDSDQSLLDAFAANIGYLFSIKDWLEANGIPFVHTYEYWQPQTWSEFSWVRIDCAGDSIYMNALPAATAHVDMQNQFKVKGESYFVLTATNGQTIGKSEMYSRSSGMENGIESVEKNGPDA